MPDKTFRPFDPNQTYLFEQDPRDWLGDDHIVFFVEDILEQVDYEPFYAYYEDEARGGPPYDPRVMVRIITYGYVTSVRSSRNLAEACVENVAFRYLAGGNQPKKTAICDFHNNHREALTGLLTQVTQIALSMELADVAEVFIDGSKLEANANLEANQAYEELVAEQAAIEASIMAWFAAVDEADEDEATAGSVDKDRLPPGLQARKDRLERIREAKDQLEEMGREQAREQEAKWEAYEARQPHPGRPPNRPDYHPPEGTKRNTTDPDSRIMWRRGTHVQGFNAQAAVSREGLVLAGDVVNAENDQRQLGSMVEAVETATGERPGRAVADAGYWHTAEIQELPEGVEVFVVPPDKRGGGKDPPDDETKAIGEAEEASLFERFKAKARTGKAKALQRVRSAVVEPVFGDARFNKGVDKFLRRGLSGARVEWALGLVAVDLVRMFGMVQG